ncbi:MAG: hypothetical protein DRJ56_07350 [Thermoprotei archaeon]|nr:MAG: hypothetical protein DRJ56_07350 [Thermoprotei archaeon]
MLLAELGDKTQIAMMLMAASLSKVRVFLGGLASLLAMSLISLAVGEALGSALPLSAVRAASGLAFLALAVIMALARREGGEVRLPAGAVEPFCAAFAVTFLAELGDKTQLTVLTLAMKLRAPLSVFLGSAAAFALVNGLGVALGGEVLRRLPERALKAATCATFAAFGAATLLGLT